MGRMSIPGPMSGGGYPHLNTHPLGILNPSDLLNPPDTHPLPWGDPPRGHTQPPATDT